MKATRDGFGEQLVESGKENPNIILYSAPNVVLHGLQDLVNKIL